MISRDPVVDQTVDIGIPYVLLLEIQKGGKPSEMFLQKGTLEIEFERESLLAVVRHSEGEPPSVIVVYGPYPVNWRDLLAVGIDELDGVPVDDHRLVHITEHEDEEHNPKSQV